MKFIPSKCIFIVVLFMISSCTPAVSPIIADTTCEAPCWRNIHPGITSKEELIIMLNQMEDVIQEKIFINNGPWHVYDDLIRIYFMTGEEAEINILNNRVSVMLFYGKNITTFDEVINKFGEPEYILNLHLWGPGIFEFGNTTHETIIGVNPHTGIAYAHDNYHESISRRGKISPNSNIEDLFLFFPEDFDFLMEAKAFTFGMLSREDALKRFVPWDGYGVIDEKYPFQPRK